ncbi:Leukocyte-specific transcript 1 protein [Saguinus oedipus]|uniref:Leukocyte-specific transcript 1 protein n=1 Tax=Saguinus oedipus TaxID=9490 RepID=A0ABQ9VVJ1_SAGOE|nr:Leukocyte-specific transcript 1 protein [Saguinus oedipus]
MCEAYDQVDSLWGQLMQEGKGPHRRPRNSRDFSGKPLKVKRLESSWPQAQGSSEQELHYASLQRLPVPSSEGPDLRDREERGTKEDPRADYACVAENKPT